jgi:hypothetical protein
MSECGCRAVLTITQSVEGTTTNVVRERIELVCREAAGHVGPHRDPARGESWEGSPNKVTTILRNEDELED